MQGYQDGQPTDPGDRPTADLSGAEAVTPPMPFSTTPPVQPPYPGQPPSGPPAFGSPAVPGPAASGYGSPPPAAAPGYPAPYGAPSPVAAPSAAPPGANGRVVRRVLLGVAAFLVVGALSVGTGWYLGRPDPAPDPAAQVPPSATQSATAPARPPSTGRPPAGSSGPITPSSAVAGCTMSPGKDAAQNTVPYDARNMIDGDPATAWRCPGNARQSVTFALGSPTVTVTEVALIPGYAKTDPVDGADRFAQNYTVTRVRWSFTGGDRPREYEQAITRPDRQFARFALPEPVSATTLTMTIVDTAAPTARPGSNVGIAVSEVSVKGVR